MSYSFPVICSTLDTKALLQAINEQYEVKTETCRLWKDGVNAVYILKTEMGTLYLRISHAARFSKKDYEEEIAVINALHEQGIPAVIPIANKNNDYLWEIHALEGIRYAVLFNEAKNAASGNRMNQLYNLGITAAKLHKAADEQVFSVSREPIMWHQLAEHPLKMLAEPLQHRQPDFEFLETAAMKLWDYVTAALPQKAPYYGYCHGDMHSGNIFFVEDQPQIFDFDCMGYGYRVYDICIFAWKMTIEQQNFIETQSWKMYLEGYSSIRKLGEDELRCIPAFAALRCIWLMGLHLDGTAYKNSWSVFNDVYFNNNIMLFKLWYYRVFPELNPV